MVDTVNQRETLISFLQRLVIFVLSIQFNDFDSIGRRDVGEFPGRGGILLESENLAEIFISLFPVAHIERGLCHCGQDVQFSGLVSLLAGKIDGIDCGLDTPLVIAVEALRAGKQRQCVKFFIWIAVNGVAVQSLHRVTFDQGKHPLFVICQTAQQRDTKWRQTISIHGFGAVKNRQHGIGILHNHLA